MHAPVAPEPRQREAAVPPDPLDEVLRAINRIRVQQGADPLYELPSGTTAFDGGGCVLENAFADLGVSYVDYRYAHGKGLRIEHGLGSFIREFDAGTHPGLIRPA